MLLPNLRQCIIEERRAGDGSMQSEEHGTDRAGIFLQFGRD